MIWVSGKGLENLNLPGLEWTGQETRRVAGFGKNETI
jgi:hypothetical protein